MNRRRSFVQKNCHACLKVDRSDCRDELLTSYDGNQPRIPGWRPSLGLSEGVKKFLTSAPNRNATIVLASMTTPLTSAFASETIRQHGLTPEEYEKIQRLLGGREPTLTELGIFSVMWSEHCSYKSSRVHLKRLPTRSKLVVQGPGENAGIVDIGGGWACAFKIESHNHPSFIEPFQGAATGVGGILRDIFTMGARPVAVMDSLRFGPIEAPSAGGGPGQRPAP